MIEPRYSPVEREGDDGVVLHRREVSEPGRSRPFEVAGLCRLRIGMLLARHVITKDGEWDGNLGRDALQSLKLIERLTAVVDAVGPLAAAFL